MLVVLGITGVLVFAATLAALYRPTRTGSEAFNAGGAGKVYLSPATASVYPGENVTSTIKFNTGGQSISGLAMRMTFPCGASCTTPNLDPVTSGGAQATGVTLDPVIINNQKWSAAVNSVTRANNQVTVDLVLAYVDIVGFSSSNDVNIGSLSLKANAVANVTMTFDTTRSSMMTKASPPVDILGTATGATYSVQNDTTAPAAVSNLGSSTATTNSVTLSWTAPSDTGPTGKAASYEVRYSTSPITSANFSSATAVTGVAAPKAAGQAESLVVSGLASNTQYYFAMKSIDSAGNASALSNVYNVTTANPNSTLTFAYRLQGVDSGPIPAGYNNSATLTLKNVGTGTVALTKVVTVSADGAGVYTPTTLVQLGALPIGGSGTSYDLFVKDPTHLQKKLGTMTIVYGANNSKTTLGEPELMAGEFDTGAGSVNILNLADISTFLNQYKELSVPASTAYLKGFDVNQNGTLEFQDLAVILANYTKIDVLGD